MFSIGDDVVLKRTPTWYGKIGKKTPLPSLSIGDCGRIAGIGSSYDIVMDKSIPNIELIYSIVWEKCKNAENVKKSCGVESEDIELK